MMLVGAAMLRHIAILFFARRFDFENVRRRSSYACARYRRRPTSTYRDCTSRAGRRGSAVDQRTVCVIGPAMPALLLASP